MKLQEGLIVSCQALENEPLHKYNLMGAMADAAVCGGAVGIRACGARDISEIRKVVSVPIIGLIKKVYRDSEIYITPTKAEVDILGNSDCDVIALDATLRKRPNNESLDEIVAYSRKKYPEKYLMADIADEDDAVNAARLSFDYVSTTLRGYTAQTKNIAIPDFEFLESIMKIKNVKIIAEGGIWDTMQLQTIVSKKPFAVVIGTAITRPQDITKRFNVVMKDFGGKND